jgi:hypothetical protein
MPKILASEPASFVTTGFSVADLLSKEFLTELKKEFPKAIPAALIISMEDPKGIVSISQEMSESKVKGDSVEIDGSEPKYVQRILEVLKRA